MKKLLMFAWMTGIGLTASALTVENALNATMGVGTSSAANGTFVSNTVPEKPGDGDDPPDGFGGGETKPEDRGEEEEKEDFGGGSSGSEDSVILSGAWQYTAITNTLTGWTLESTNSDQNVILAQSNACVTVSNCVLNKSGNMSNEDNSNFFAVNAVVAAKSAARVYIENSQLYSNANGANCLFASGSNSTIYAYGCDITSTLDSSRGLDATYGGTVIGSKLSIDTTGAHCAALATDRGSGYISATASSLTTAGNGSPLIYSTGAIEVNCVTGTASGAQIAGIEGLSVIRIKNSILSGSEKHASEPWANGVIIYQSMSGDYTTGTATFEVSDSTLTSAITSGAMFYITNTKTYITIQNSNLEFDSDNNYLLLAAGNNTNNWGTAGANGGEVVFTAIDQTLTGDMSVDGISSLDMYLVDSDYTGTFVLDTATYSGSGGTDLYINSNSTWKVSASCTLKDLTVMNGAKIVDDSGNAVSIVGTDGTEYVSGTSNPKVTVDTYTTGNFVATNITAFAINRSAFEKMYATSSGADSLTPGVSSEPYDDAQSATNAAAKINSDKSSGIIVPTGLEASSTSTYLSKVEATVTGDNCVVVDLTPAAETEVQGEIDEAVTNETAVAAFTSTNDSAIVTISTTTPGLYYWIIGGTEVGAITNAGTGVLSTNGGAVELTKPTLDSSKNRAFFKVGAGVAAPLQ